MRRLSIEVSSEQHQQIKALAALQGKSIKDFILNKLFNESNENEKAALAELEELLLTRIKLSKDSQVSSNTFQEITDNVLRANKI